MKVFACIAIGAGLTAAAAQAVAAPPPAIYTPAQASAGATVFAQSCASCHGATLQGEAGPALTGPGFVAGVGNNIGSLFSLVAQQMPLSSPGSLSQTQYEDVVAYILSKNGYPAGSTALNYTQAMTSTVPLVSAGK